MIFPQNHERDGWGGGGGEGTGGEGVKSRKVIERGRDTKQGSYFAMIPTRRFFAFYRILLFCSFYYFRVGKMRKRFLQSI